MASRALLVCLLLASACAAPSRPAPAPPVERPPEVDKEKAFWKEKILGIQPSWGRKELQDFLDGIRVSSTHRSVFLDGGGSGSPTIWYNLYSLDSTWGAYVVWNEIEGAKGIRSAEVVGFPDLRHRIDPDLFDAVSAIHQSPSAQRGLEFSTVSLVRAVNALQPLGREQAVKALWSYYRLARALSAEEARKYSLDEFRLHPILQLLFQGISGYRLGGGDVDVDYPVVVVQDVPFMLVSGYTLMGRPLDAAEYLGQATTHLRASPLLPRTTTLEAADELIRSPLWKGLNLGAGMEGRKRWQIRRQALWASSSVFALRPEESSSDCCVDPTETQWRAAVDRAKAIGIVWSPEIQDFILGR